MIIYVGKQGRVTAYSPALTMSLRVAPDYGLWGGAGEILPATDCARARGPHHKARIPLIYF